MKFKINTKKIQNISKKMSISSNSFLNKIEFTGLLINVFSNKITFESKSEFLLLKCILKDEELFQIEKVGKVLIKSKLFNEIISKINDKEVEIFTIDNNNLFIKSENFEYELNLMEVENFQEENFNLNDGETLKIHSDKFKKMFNSVIFSGDENAPRRILQGVNLIIENNVARVIASDNTRVTMQIQKMDSNDQKVNKIIPIKSLKEIIKVFDSDEEMTLIFKENKILITTEEFLLKTNLIEGVFPNVEKLFPVKFKNYLEIDRDRILNLIENSIVLNLNKNSNNNIVKVIFGNNEMNVEFRELEIGYSNLRERNFSYQGEKNFYISFQPKLLLEAVKSISDEKIKIGFNDSNSAFVIFGKENFKSLILPYLI